MAGHRTVLVVEDNDMNMQLVEYLLEEGGYSIVKATSGEEALSLTRSETQRPDLIPILALTAHAMRGDKDRFLEAGCDGYISKPIDVKTFLTSIEQYIH